MFSLCIATINRFDDFLSTFLPSYLSNPLIAEIIITDETGNDVDAIKGSSYGQDPKLKMFKNDTRLGPLLNKHKAMKLATQEWIAIIDSDNFADEKYFLLAKEFIEREKPSPMTIISPYFAEPGFNSSIFAGHAGFNFKNFIGMNLTLQNIRSLPANLKQEMDTLFNLGNNIINKTLIDNFTFEREDPAMIDHSSSFDVIYFNTMLYEQFALNFYVLADMTYKHSVHGGSVYLTTHQQNTHYSNLLHNRFKNMISQ